MNNMLICGAIRAEAHTGQLHQVERILLSCMSRCRQVRFSILFGNPFLRLLLIVLEKLL